jgi:hypothetical protein
MAGSALLLGALLLAGCDSQMSPIAVRPLSTTSQLFGIEHVISQIHPAKNEWLAAGLACPGSSYPCGLPFLVLAGALRQGGQWRVRLLVRYFTATEPDPPGPCKSQISDGLNTGQTDIIVGCFNGGSDQESFVTVLGFNT